LCEHVTCLETSGKDPNLYLLSAFNASAPPIGSSERYTSGYRDAITATNSPIDNQRVGHRLGRLWNGWSPDQSTVPSASLCEFALDSAMIQMNQFYPDEN
jgi:hypothetical protein